MSLAVKVLPGATLPSSGPITLDQLQSLGLPVIWIEGLIGLSDMAQGAVDGTILRPGPLIFGAATLTGKTYALNPSPPLLTLTAGSRVWFSVDVTCPDFPFLNVSGLGAKWLVKHGGALIKAGDLHAGQMVAAVYDGANWQVTTVLGNPRWAYSTSGESTTTKDNGDGTFTTTTVTRGLDGSNNPQVTTTVTVTDSTGAVLSTTTTIDSTHPFDVNALTATLPDVSVTDYSQIVGLPIALKIAYTNTGAVTLSLNGLAPTALQTSTGGELPAGVLAAGQLLLVFYDGTKFVCPSLVNASPALATTLNLNLTKLDAYRLTVTADTVAMRSVGGLMQTETSVTLNADLGADATHNGLDQGSKANNTWYWLFLITDGANTNALLSLKRTVADGLLLPTGYQWSACIGAVKTDTTGALCAWVNLEQRLLTTDWLTLPSTASGTPAATADSWTADANGSWVQDVTLPGTMQPVAARTQIKRISTASTAAPWFALNDVTEPVTNSGLSYFAMTLQAGKVAWRQYQSTLTVLDLSAAGTTITPAEWLVRLEVNL